MKLWLSVAACALLVSCVSTSGIVPDGPDAYRIAAEGRTGAQTSGNLQGRNYDQAAAFCAERGKVVETLSTDSKQSRPLGGYPEASLRFRCVDREDR